MTPMQATVFAAASCVILYAYFLTVLVTAGRIERFPGPIRFIATLSSATAPLSLLGRITGVFICALSLGLLLVLVTVRSYELDPTQIGILYVAIALATLWTVYLVRAMRRR